MVPLHVPTPFPCLDLRWLLWFVGTGTSSPLALPESRSHERSQSFGAPHIPKTLGHLHTFGSKRSKIMIVAQCLGSPYHQNIGTLRTSLCTCALPYNSYLADVQ